jgi:hypothetical protein
MLARVAGTQALANKNHYRWQAPQKKKATHEVALGWLFDGSQNDFCSSKLYCDCLEAEPKTGQVQQKRAGFEANLRLRARYFWLFVINQ